MADAPRTRPGPTAGPTAPSTAPSAAPSTDGASARATGAADPVEPIDAIGALEPLGTWPGPEARVLRARLESVGIPVLATGDVLGFDSRVQLAVARDRLDFARAVVTELDVDDEVPDSSPEAYLARVDEHLQAIAALLEELRRRLP